MSAMAKFYEQTAEGLERHGGIHQLTQASTLYIQAAKRWQRDAAEEPEEKKPDFLRLAERNFRAAAACLDRVADMVARQSEITTRGN